MKTEKELIEAFKEIPINIIKLVYPFYILGIMDGQKSLIELIKTKKDFELFYTQVKEINEKIYKLTQT